MSVCVEYRPMATRRRLPGTQVLFGAIIVLAGLLLLLDTTEVFPTGELLRLVPSLFVLVGLWALVASGFRNLVGPVVLIGVAGAWQLVALDVATAAEVGRFWPLLIVAFGLSLVVGHYRSPRDDSADARLSTLAIFGGAERRSTSQSFSGADLTAVFGGTELDLRDAAVADPPARVNALALFGGAEIVVPREWNVRMDVIPILGGASDDRPRSAERNEDLDLVVTGFTAFGGITVTD
jgi:hypothetical protein